MKPRTSDKAHRRPPESGGNGSAQTFVDAGSDSAPKSVRELTDRILADEAKLRQGGGPAGHERQKRLGRLSVRHRLDLLLDPDTSLRHEFMHASPSPLPCWHCAARSALSFSTSW